MTLVRIAWRNLWRHRRRTLLTASGMAVAMGFVLCMASFQDGMFDMMADVMVRQQFGHAQVNHPDWPGREQMYDTVPYDLAKTLQGSVEVQGASGRLFSFALADSDHRSAGARFVGVHPKDDLAITDLSRNLVRGAYLSAAPAGEVVVGEAMARELEIELGADIVFLGQAADGSMANELLKVVGTYSTGMDQMDKSGAYMHVEDLQRILALDNQVHQILVVGDSMDTSSALAATVRAVAGGEDIQVRSWEEASPDMAKMMGMRDAGLFVMLFVIFSVAGLAILNTNLMTVFERTRELGVLRAIGMTRARMMALVILESVLLSAVAVVLGLALGGFLDWLLVTYGFPYEVDGKGLSWQGVTFPTRFYGSVRPYPFVVTTVFVFFVAVAASVWPAARAALLRPVEAMRENA